MQISVLTSLLALTTASVNALPAPSPAESAAAAATTTCPTSTRTGTINVITNDTTIHGCLNAAGLFHASTSVANNPACAAFTATEWTITSEYWPYCGTPYYNFTTSAGRCGAPYVTGSQYEQGNNHVWRCGGEIGDNTPYWQFTTGVNDLKDTSNLIMYGAVFLDSYNTILGKVPRDGEDAVLQLREPDAPTGPDYYLAFQG